MPTVRRSTVIRAMLMVALYWFSMYVYVPYTATYLKSLSVSQALIGLVAGAYGFAQILLRPPLGVTADLKGSPRVFILIGVITPAAASLLRLLLPTGSGFLGANILSGIGAAMWICFMTYFAGLFGKGGMQQATALIMGANGFGQLIGFAASTLLYGRFGMPVLCALSIAAAGLATGLALSLGRRPQTDGPAADGTLAGKPAGDALGTGEPAAAGRTGAPGSREPAATGNGTGAPGSGEPAAAGIQAEPPRLRLNDLMRVFRNRRLLFFSIFGLMQTGIVLSTVTNFDTQRIRALGGSDTLVGLMTITFMVIQMLSAMLSSVRSFRRLGARIWIPAAMLSITLYCFLSPAASAVWQIYALQILSGFFSGVITSFAVAEGTREIPTRMRTTAMGIYQCAVAVGIALLPMITGRMADAAGGFHSAYMLLGSLSAVCLLLGIWGTRTSKLDAARPLNTVYPD